MLDGASENRGALGTAEGEGHRMSLDVHSARPASRLWDEPCPAR